MISLIGCAKWVNVDISNETVEILSPINHLKDSIQNKTFWWKELNGANRYQVQIVSPNFDSIVTKIHDITDSSTSLDLTLLPGEYQWRIRGINDDFKSEWNTYNLEVTSTSYLTGQTITGISPADGFNTNLMSINFLWDELYASDSYILRIFDINNTLIELNSGNLSSHSFTFLDEGLYSIKLQALNDLSASNESNFTIRIDTTSPSLNTHLYPKLDTIYSFPSEFKWTTTTNNGSSIQENLIIGKDSLFNQILLDTTFNEATSIQLDTILKKGKLFWKINRTDAAGNGSNATSYNTFWVD